MPFGKRYKHLYRYRQVANILAKHGFGYLLDQLGLSDMLSYHQRLKKTGEKRAERLSRGERLRMALEELGPTFIKLGQLLSTRPDLLPKDIIAQLEKLQDRVSPFPFFEVKRLVEEELGQEMPELFASFDEQPLAAASIGQVHKARLKNGEQVVVKVRRPGVERIVATDLDILFDLARMAEKHTSWGKMYSLVEMVEEFNRFMRQELDYGAEGRNAERFAKNFAGDDTVYIPSVFWDYTSSKVLTLEYVEGVKLTNLQELENRRWDRKRIAGNLSRAVLKQILINGYFHGDPHPGNLAVREGHVIVFMDFGITGTLTQERKKQFVRLALALVRGDSNRVVRTILDMNMGTGQVDMRKFRRDVEIMRDRYYTIPFSEINLGEAVSEILDLAFKYGIRIPTEFTLLAKALLTLEGVVQELDPDLNIITVAEPFAKTLIRQRLAPKNLGREIWEILQEYSDILLEMPRQVSDILGKVQEGALTMKLEHRNLQQAINQLDKVANKLSFSIVLLSFSIVVAGLVIGASLGADEPSFLWQLPILEVGFGVASIMFVWLIIAIFRSGRF